MNKRRIISWICLFCLIFILYQPAKAASPEKRREFAWGILAFTGKEYKGVFSPLEKPTIYFLANSTNLLRSRYTMVYYWPIDREYKPDWTTENTEVQGTLIVKKAGAEVIQIERQLYLLNDISMSSIDRGQLLLGDEALSVYDNYVNERFLLR